MEKLADNLRVQDKFASKRRTIEYSHRYGITASKRVLLIHKTTNRYKFLAPGKDGCVRTGIPFTSERLIRRGQFKDYMPRFGFVVEGNQAERSATIIWGSVETLASPII